MKFFIFLTISIGVLLNYCLIVNCENNDTIFIPTNEWQIVKKGQPLPRGLHISHNFTDGVTKAKLMDNNNNTNNSLNNNEIENKESQLLAMPELNPVDENDLTIPIDELKEKLKKIKLDADQPFSNKKRKIDDIMLENFEKMKKESGLNMTTDSEIITKIFSKFDEYEESLKSGSLLAPDVDEVLHLLAELENLLHQIDNAQIFADKNGMSRIISPCLNLTNDDVKIEALKILGTAVQSNKKVQIKALDNNLVKKILHLLTVSDKIQVKSKCMFALGALVRQFERAQKALIDNNGLEIFGNILEAGHPSIQIRVMKLITDLAIERDSVKLIDDKIIQQKQIKEYEKTNFEKYLVLNNYCKDLLKLLVNNFDQDLTKDSIIQYQEFIEVIFDNMLALNTICKNDIYDNEKSVLVVMEKLLNLHEEITKDEAAAGLENLQSQIQRLKSFIYSKSHDEL